MRDWPLISIGATLVFENVESPIAIDFLSRIQNVVSVAMWKNSFNAEITFYITTKRDSAHSETFSMWSFRCGSATF